MAYPELTRRAAFAAALEATPGTAATPVMASNALRLLEAPTPEEFYLAENLTDEIVTGRLGVLTLAAPGGRALRIRGRAVLVPVGSAPAAENLPEVDPLLIAAGFNRTIDATPGSEEVSYAPSDDPNTGANSTITAILQLDGKQYKLTHGVCEEFNVQVEAGGFPTVSFSVVGIAAVPTEQSLEAAGYNDVQFPIWKGAGSLAVGGATTIVPKSFGLNLGLTATPRVDANGSDGHSGYRITGRVPELQVRAEVPALTTWDPRADWNARTSRVVTALFGALADQFHQIEVYAGDCRVVNVNTVDDNRFRYYDVNYKVTMPASGTELSITFK